MANNLTNTAEALAMDWLNPALSAPTRPTSPLKARLMTADGSDSAAGTEVTGGSYAAQSITFGSGGAQTNTGAVAFTLMPACTVTGVEIWDSAGSPVRLWWGPLAAPKVVNVGDTFNFAVGAVALSID